MSPATHYLLGWLVANADRFTRRERATITLAAIAPDLDGLGIVPELLTRHAARPLNWFSDYHHRLGHNLWFALFVRAIGWLIATRKWKTALFVLLSFHLHLLSDVIGARSPDGEQWPISYLAPLSNAWQWSWDGQWALNAWPNFLITAVALTATFYLAWRRGFSPLELYSHKADGAFVQALRQRFSRPTLSARV